MCQLGGRWQLLLMGGHQELMQMHTTNKVQCGSLVTPSS